MLLKKVVVLAVFIPSIGFSSIVNQTCVNNLNAGGDINNEQVQLNCINYVSIPDPFGPLNTVIEGMIALISGFIGLLTAPPPPPPMPK